MSEVFSVLGIFLIFFICWLTPCLYNYLNIKSYYYHELFVREKEINKSMYPELYIPFKEKCKKFLNRIRGK